MTTSAKESNIMTSSSMKEHQSTTTTRVCIKNVPSTMNETQLKQHILQNCCALETSNIIITDCKLLETKSGKSRKLAFVGVKNSHMANILIQQLDKTYAGTARLSVEPAFSKQHGVRPWSKHSKGSSRYAQDGQQREEDTQKTTKEKSTKAVFKNRNDDDKMERRRKQEFLAAMGASTTTSSSNATTTKVKFWSNDDDGMLLVASEEKLQDEDESNYVSTAKTQPTEQDSSDESSDSDDSSNSFSNDSGGEGADALQSLPTTRPSHGMAMSDMDFLRSKVTAVEELSEDDENNQDEEENDTDSSSDSSDSDSSNSSSDNEEMKENLSKAQPNTAHQDDKPSTTSSADDSQISPNRLFVRNLPFAATEEELCEHFSSFGTIQSCHIPVDDQKRNKGFAFVAFETSEAAQQAMSELDGTDFQGRLLHILPARKGPNETTQDSTIDESNLTYKQKQELARQREAAKSNQGWSASFVRGDAVVDNLADRLGLRKGDILNVKEGLSSGDAAVRLALGETHIIEENREYFRKEGVDMDALVSAKGEDDNSVKRSNTSILVKNLPYDTELEELNKVFHGIGGDPPKRILLPPSRTIAMAEYGHSTDARRAFRKLAYKRFKHVPLYLEWAPLAAKVEGEDGGVSQKPDQPSGRAVQEEEKPSPDDDEDMDVEPSLSHTIYVKNLNFATTADELRKAFSKHAKEIRAVKIPTKTAPAKRIPGGNSESPPVKTLSMGFGFVECDSEESVRKALKALQGTVIDGHALELKRSTKKIDQSTSKKQSTAPASSRKSTKLMVRNVPFQASRKELLQLFGSFGQLKKVRLPKKFDGTHRGFAFIDYLTHQEALTAMNTLSRTHLYGRHLVLEWASDKDDVDTLREKAKRDVSIEGQKPRQNKKIRFN